MTAYSFERIVAAKYRLTPECQRVLDRMEMWAMRAMEWRVPNIQAQPHKVRDAEAKAKAWAEKLKFPPDKLPTEEEAQRIIKAGWN